MRQEQSSDRRWRPVLMSQQNAEDAMSIWKRNPENPYSLEVLAWAYSKSGDGDKGNDDEVNICANDAPAMKQALVMSPARSQRREAE